MGFVINLIYYVYTILELLILARCILSFLPFNNRFTGWIYMATEPLLSPFRNLMYRFNYNLPIDFSPVLAILALRLIYQVIFRIIFLIF